MDKNRKLQIITLLTVLSSGMAFAIMGVAFFAYHYSPTGQYRIKNALIAPEVVVELAYEDTNSKTGGSSRYLFDGMSFYYNNETQPVDIKAYETFYRVISSDKSLLNENIPNFTKQASLTINVRTESHAAWQDNRKTFQQIHFAGDYYSVELHEAKGSNPWIYFYHPGITEKAIEIFARKQQNSNET